jgi:hypothetical protein
MENREVKTKKKISFDEIDKNMSSKGKLQKTLWQIVKFVVVSFAAGAIQIILANLLPFVFDKITTPIPHFLEGIFNPNLIFDLSTKSGEASFVKYTVDGVVTWGFVLPFFLSNAIANIYGYIQNKKTTFNSDAPIIYFAIYIFLIVVLILFSTWLQGIIFGWLIRFNSAFLKATARTIATLICGFVQSVVLFPSEKFFLCKEKK